MLTLMIDYSLVGYADQFSTPLLHREREELCGGDTVLVVGDGVAPRKARFDALTDGEATFTFLEPVPGAERLT